MEDVVSAAQSRPRFLTLLLTLFSSVALVLAAVGLYGVISYSVAQRTSEIGIRISMGAQSADVLKLILGQGLRLGLFGVAAGAAGALAVTRLIRLAYGPFQLGNLARGMVEEVPRKVLAEQLGSGGGERATHAHRRR